MQGVSDVLNTARLGYRHDTYYGFTHFDQEFSIATRTLDLAVSEADIQRGGNWHHISLAPDVARAISEPSTGVSVDGTLFADGDTVSGYRLGVLACAGDREAALRNAKRLESSKDSRLSDTSITPATATIRSATLARSHSGRSTRRLKICQSDFQVKGSACSRYHSRCRSSHQRSCSFDTPNFRSRFAFGVTEAHAPEL